MDVGCGIGGTSRYLASRVGCHVTGITISTKQVEIAKRLTIAEVTKETSSDGVIAEGADGFVKLGKGKVRFIELDAEEMGDFFASDAEMFDVVWITEALSHFPNKALFFQNAFRVLKPSGALALADWFKAEGIGAKVFDNDIKPIEGEYASPPVTTLEVPVRRGVHWLTRPHNRRHASTPTLHPSRIRSTRC